MNVNFPHRIVIHRKVNEYEVEIDFDHILSDGFGIPSIVVSCLLESKFSKYKGHDEYGNEIEGINFDDCIDCPYWGSLGFGQEIICFYSKKSRVKKEM